MSKNVAVVTACSPGYAELGALTRPNHDAYCRRHGYDYRPFQGTDADNSWCKVRPLRSILHEINPKDQSDRYDIVLWMDADAIFTNPQVSIEGRLDEIDREYGGLSYQMGQRVPFVIATDSNGPNAGVMLMRNVDLVRELWYTVEDMWNTLRANNAKLQWNEQSVLHQRLPLGDYRECVQLQRQHQHWLNAYPRELYPLDRPRGERGWWHPGDWIMHTPGLVNANRIPLLRKMLFGVEASA